MKKLVYFLLFVQNNLCSQNPIDCFKVGDIVHSVLDKQKFTELHGGTWRSLSNQSLFVDNIDSSDLIKVNINSDGIFDNPALSIVKANDSGDKHTYINFQLSNTFIRAMNVGREEGTGDTKPREKAGYYEKSVIQEHQHLLPVGTDIRNLWEAFNRSNAITVNPGTGITTAIAGSSRETIPKNITLYVYIKVSQ